MSGFMEHGYWIHTWNGEFIHSESEIGKQYITEVNRLISEKDVKVFPKDDVILRKYDGSGMFEKITTKLTNPSEALDELTKDREGYNGCADIIYTYEKEFPFFNGTCLQKLGFFFKRKFVNYGKEIGSCIEWN